eukprot:TRINITY_DN8476_c0_g1_i1.p1 TRINITY_DN8476_c0_g1~~TRINITY_DN8476_c0_g1_i1.p1  ORF type:complete len:311 (-),score=66.69 TRINITY_DN8476_c0_g1_i1:10-942(-)
MADGFDTKSFARSKHFHSLHKDKNKYKKKAKHVALAKKQQSEQNQQQTTNSQPAVSSDDDEEEEEEGLSTEETQALEKLNKLAVSTSTEDKQKKTETEYVPRQRSKFSRRIVQSNDFRFSKELQEEEDLKQEKTASIGDLLAQAVAGGSSHFRFQGEEEWDNDELLLTKALSIDFEAISRNLRANISLSQQLRIDAELFTPDILKTQQRTDSERKPDRGGAFMTAGLSSSKTSKGPKATTSAPKSTKLQPAPEMLTDRTDKTDTEMLDDLLDMSKPPVEETPSTTSSTEGKSEPAKKGEEDLESWLDSVI